MKFTTFIWLLGLFCPAWSLVGEVVTITNDLGHVLYASLFRPDPVSFPGLRPAIVIAHGSGGVYRTLNASGYPTDMETEYESWAVLAQSNGYFALFVDSYNPQSGRSAGKSNANSAYIRPHDIYAGNAYLRNTSSLVGGGGVNTSAIYLLGISHGSTAVLATLSSSDPHRTTLPFTAGVGYYACCGCAECSGEATCTSTSSCDSCSVCPLCGCTNNRYCPYAPLLIFAASNDASCGTGYYNAYGSGWGGNWCDERIVKARANTTCPISYAQHKFALLTYNATEHGFDYLGNSATYFNNECARAHSRAQTLSWFSATTASIDGSACASNIYS